MGLFGFGKPNIEKLKAKRDVEGLIKALSYKEFVIRKEAAEALSKIRNKRAVEPLIKVLKDEDEDVRGSAAEALGAIKDARAVEPLIQALKDEDDYVRKSAARALGAIGDTRAIKPLIDSLNDWKWREDSALMQGFVAETSGRRTVVETLGTFHHPRALNTLISCVSDKFPLISFVAIEALGKIGDPVAVEPLIKALGDESWEIRLQAAESLGLIEDNRAGVHLQAALKDENTKVRNAAKKALKNISNRVSQKSSEKKKPDHPVKKGSTKTKSPETSKSSESSSVGDFVEQCLRPQYTEQTETRNIKNMPELQTISNLGNSGEYKTVIQKAKRLLKKYPDLDFLYFWMCIAYLGLDDYTGASSILKEGLKKAKSKAWLCCKLGEVAWKSKDARETLKWWCQSIHCHESNPHDLDNTPYLYLAAVAGAFGLKQKYDAFTARAYSIKNATLTFEAMTDLQKLFVHQKTNSMELVLKKMFELYLRNY